MTNQILAAGGLVFRKHPDGYEVLIVHRPSYDDWSLPKGKINRKEPFEAAAIREVEEETGVRCRIISEVGTSEYQTPGGADKLVQFYAMRPVKIKDFKPNREVDEIAWLHPDRAVEILTYSFDRGLVAGAPLQALSRTGTVFLVRHAHAGSRSDFKGEDTYRPLIPRGKAQAKKTSQKLADLGVDSIFSSPALRCLQTIDPLAKQLGLKVNQVKWLAEGASPVQAVSFLEEGAGLNMVYCSHGDVLPAILRILQFRGTKLELPNQVFEFRKGAIWLVRVEDGHCTKAEYLPPPQ